MSLIPHCEDGSRIELLDFITWDGMVARGSGTVEAMRVCHGGEGQTWIALDVIRNDGTQTTIGLGSPGDLVVRKAAPPVVLGVVEVDPDMAQRLLALKGPIRADELTATGRDLLISAGSLLRAYLIAHKAESQPF